MKILENPNPVPSTIHTCEKCGSYTYIGYCDICEDYARYTGNL